MITLRPYQDADLAPLLSIINAIVARGDAFTYDPAFTPAAFGAYIKSFSAAYVAELESRVVGGYLLKPNQPGRGAHVCNAAYMVDASVRGHGIGRRMGEHSLREAARLGFRSMQFNAVVSTNTSAVKLWKGLGFRILATVPEAFHHADGRYVDLYVMFRELP